MISLFSRRRQKWWLAAWVMTPVPVIGTYLQPSEMHDSFHFRHWLIRLKLMGRPSVRCANGCFGLSPSVGKPHICHDLWPMTHQTQPMVSFHGLLTHSRLPSEATKLPSTESFLHSVCSYGHCESCMLHGFATNEWHSNRKKTNP